MPQPWPADILALLIAIAGWYYMLYSRAAHRLKGFDTDPINVWRVLLRRINGGIIVVLGALVFAGSQNLPPVAFIVVWASVLGLLLLAIALAIIDIRLTWKMNRERNRGPR